MTLSALGIFSAAGAGGVAGPSYELIQSYILTGTQATITFSNLGDYANDYEHLEIRYTARTNRGTDAADILEMLVNGNAATKTHILFGQGFGTIGSDTDQYGLKNIGYTAAPAFPANGFGAGVITILDAYSTTKNKTARVFGGLPQGAGDFRGVTLASAFYGTTAVSSITLDVIASFIAGSRFSIYGIKG